MEIRVISFFLLGTLMFISTLTPNVQASCVGLNLEDAGNGVYRVVAHGLVKVGGIDLTIAYDKTSLSNPKVARGDLVEWLVFLPNIVETTGRVRVAMVNEPPVSGSGTVAIISFTPSGKVWERPVLTCELTALDASNQPIDTPLTDPTVQESISDTNNSGEVPVITTQTEITLQPNATPQRETTQLSGVSPQTGTAQQKNMTSQTGTTSQSTTSQQSTSTKQSQNPPDNGTIHESVRTTSSASPGIINLGTIGSISESEPHSEPSSPLAQEPSDPSLEDQQPSPGDAESDENEIERSPASGSPPSSVPISQHSVLGQEQKYSVYRGIFQRFKDYGGERTQKTFEALFDQPIAATIRQEPPVCIADGKKSLKVTVELPAENQQAPNFALRGASLKALKKLGDNRWVIEAVPDAGKVEAILTIVNGERMTDYPFTIAPRVNIDIDKNGVVDRADFSLFISKVGTDASPAFDLNGDGQRDYEDDYIFTANYLVSTGKK